MLNPVQLTSTKKIKAGLQNLLLAGSCIYFDYDIIVSIGIYLLNQFIVICNLCLKSCFPLSRRRRMHLEALHRPQIHSEPPVLGRGVALGFQVTKLHLCSCELTHFRHEPIYAKLNYECYEI